VRVLLDEQLPRQLTPLLTSHEVRTVQQQSWAGLKNGALLDAAEVAGFSVLLTGDQNLQFQLVPGVLDAINTVRPGQVIRVEA
jgi:hypothetical protein